MADWGLTWEVEGLQSVYCIPSFCYCPPATSLRCQLSNLPGTCSTRPPGPSTSAPTQAPKIPATKQLLPKSKGIEELAELVPDKKVAGQLYDHWHKRRQQHGGPLLERLWFEVGRVFSRGCWFGLDCCCLVAPCVGRFEGGVVARVGSGGCAGSQGGPVLLRACTACRLWFEACELTGRGLPLVRAAACLQLPQPRLRQTHKGPGLPPASLPPTPPAPAVCRCPGSLWPLRTCWATRKGTTSCCPSWPASRAAPSGAPARGGASTTRTRWRRCTPSDRSWRWGGGRRGVEGGLGGFERRRARGFGGGGGYDESLFWVGVLDWVGQWSVVCLQKERVYREG